MIDTIRMKYKFPDDVSYNKCYEIIDNLARKKSKKHCLHKVKKKTYSTTAFASEGLLEINFFKRKKIEGNIIQLNLKPANLINESSYLKLSNYNEDYKLIEKKFNCIMNYINNCAEKILLPKLNDWKVNRIDYAVDIETPYVQEYINLFKRGFIPKGFRHYKDYETSIYLTSKKCRINFYDKFSELKNKFGLTNNDIKSELGYLPEGVLRLEIQCENKKIQRIKEKYELSESKLAYLWSETIAFDIISHYIKAIIGKEDCFTLNYTLEKIGAEYKKRTYGLCAKLVTILAKYKDSSLANMKNNYHIKKDFNQQIFKIRRAGVNPITLESIRDDIKELKHLTNPYKLIQF